MIPYFQITKFYIGPIPIQIWGLFVSAGILAAIFFSTRAAREKGLNSSKILDASLGMIISAFVLARLVHVFGYFSAYYLAQPSEIWKIWHGGFSAVGGLVGGIVYFLFFAWKHKLAVWSYLDVLAQGFPLGYAIGRIGCFLIHDHPGTLSHFVLAVKYPSASRHDLGLDLSLSAWVMFLVVLGLRRLSRKASPESWLRRDGFWVSLVFIWYGLTRFFLDFLRAYDLPFSDARYFSLTVAQYFGLILILTGACKLVTLKKYARQ
ncbi:prolipoprotein diacylglyceryl transferase [Candidatus Uhrbacteria bacterium]|nr:prolipoprotein diacylglyceryl transferase [Candidatus Uhrbacteria bacterium]